MEDTTIEIRYKNAILKTGWSTFTFHLDQTGAELKTKLATLCNLNEDDFRVLHRGKYVY